MKVTASYIPNKESSARLQLAKHKEDTEMHILVWSSFYLAAFTLKCAWTLSLTTLSLSVLITHECVCL